jgi:hypothetical protein
MLRHGSPQGLLWSFGALTAPFGVYLWHGQGQHFGFGSAGGNVDRGVAYRTMVVGLALLTGTAIFEGE